MSYDENSLLKDIEQLKQGFFAVKTEIAKVIVGQDDVVAKVLMALLSGGHCLLLGVPGLAKTLLVRDGPTAMCIVIGIKQASSF